MPRKPNAEAEHTMLRLTPQIKRLLITLCDQQEQPMSRVVSDALIQAANGVLCRGCQSRISESQFRKYDIPMG